MLHMERHPTTSHRQLEPIIITSAPTIRGSSRGKKLGIPTINVDPSSAPKELQHGIYACWITIGTKQYGGAMHYGPRPVFQDVDSLEVHVLDATIDEVPRTVTIKVVARIRDVQDFPCATALMERIAEDMKEARAILALA